MKNKKYNKIRLTTTLILLMIVMSSVHVFSPFQLSGPFSGSDNETENSETDSDVNPIETIEEPLTSALGNESWWDTSYLYRRLINITNPYAVNFTDYAVNVVFNYDELVQEGKMQEDLDDIRILEEGVPRSYYVARDYPLNGYATVFFDTNITENTPDLDTYIYFGNEDAENAEAVIAGEAFGWVKNGNFELDINETDNFNPFAKRLSCLMIFPALLFLDCGITFHNGEAHFIKLLDICE